MGRILFLACLPVFVFLTGFSTFFGVFVGVDVVLAEVTTPGKRITYAGVRISSGTVSVAG